MTKSIEHNIARLAERNATRHPERDVFRWVSLDERARFSAGSHLPHLARQWGETYEESARIAAGLSALGIGRGDRVVVFLPMSVELYVVLCALERLGAVAVVLESWVGRAYLERGCALVEPKALVSFEIALELCKAIPALARVPLFVSVGPRERRYHASLEELASTAARAPIAAVEPDHPALITFTTGSSGEPKGAIRTHAFLAAQHAAIDAHLPYGDDDVDLPVFPIFCLNNAAAGVTTVLPAIDAGQPRDDDAEVLAAQIASAGVSCMTLNPGLLRALARHALDAGAPLTSLRRVAVGGAPVSADDARLFARAAPRARLEVLYGSTEVEPICCIDGDELIASEGAREGVCAGRPTSGLRLELLAPTRAPIVVGHRGLLAHAAAPGDAGEIVVAGAHVCPGYWNDDDAFARSKIRDERGAVWHRTGDVGQLDERGRVWIVGRVHNLIHRDGRVLFPVGVECALRALPGVCRAAYLGLPDDRLGERAVCAVELDDSAGEGALRSAIEAACAALGMPCDEVFVLDALPMDARHHSKVEVDALRALLAEHVSRPPACHDDDERSLDADARARSAA